MQKRSLVSVVLLSFVTLGIYMLYWLYVTRRDLVKELGNEKAVPSLAVLFSPIIFIVLWLVFFIVLAAGSDDTPTSANLLSLIFTLLIIPLSLGVSIWWYNRFSKALYEVTKGTEPVMLVVLYVVLSFAGLTPIWLLLAQNDINKHLEAGAGTGGQVADTPYPNQMPSTTPTPEQPVSPAPVDESNNSSTPTTPAA